MNRTSILLLAVLLLAGCTTPPVRPPAADRELAWQHHRAALADLEQWRLTGRIAIHTGGEAWHATLDWRQRRQRYDIRLLAPMGQGSVRVQGGPDEVVLDTGTETHSAADAESLLYRRFGWRVPVAALRYWVVGLPEPGTPAELRLDEHGRLAYLEQAGWKIEFRQYTRQEGRELPARIFASNHQAQLRLAAGQWQVSGFK